MGSTSNLLVSMTPWSVATGLLLAALSALWVLWAWQQTYWRRRNVPSLPVEPFFGNTRDNAFLRSSTGDTFRRLYNELRPHPLGGVFQTLSPVLVLRDPELIKQVLIKDFAYFEERGTSTNEKKNPLNAHLFNLEGARWRKLRVKLTPTFTSGKMKMMFRLMHECAMELRSMLEEPAKRGDVVEMKDVVAKYATDVVGSCAFGLHFHSMKDPDSEFRRMAKAAFGPSLRLGFRQAMMVLAPFIFNVIRFPPKKVSDFLFRIVRETVEYREKKNVVRNDFLQLLMEIRNRGQLLDDCESTSMHSGAADKSSVQDESEMTGQQQKSISKDADDIELTDALLAAQVFVFFVAGYETSSTTMGFALQELALNLEIQDRVQSEIDEVLRGHNGELTFESIQEMDYLGKVIQETLRKYPAIPVLNRRCTKTYSFPGTEVRVEKGTRLIVPILGLQNDPEYFPQPEKFQPERFSEESKAQRPRFAYLPFGEGPRNCIGMRFGLLQTKLGLAVLLHYYRFTACEKTQRQVVLEPKAIFTMSKGGNWLKITARN